MDRFPYAAQKCMHCDSVALVKRGRRLCSRHYRYEQMCDGAKRSQQAIPTYEQLDAMPGTDLVCPDCSVEMGWFKSDKGAARTASLQHYRDGTLAIVCMSCNARHASMPGDQFRDLPKEHKKCPKCSEVKPFDMFYRDRHRGGVLMLSSYCKTCLKQARTDWRHANAEAENASARRRYHARRSAA